MILKRKLFSEAGKKKLEERARKKELREATRLKSVPKGVSLLNELEEVSERVKRAAERAGRPYLIDVKKISTVGMNRSRGNVLSTSLDPVVELQNRKNYLANKGNKLKIGEGPWMSTPQDVYKNLSQKEIKSIKTGLKLRKVERKLKRFLKK